MKAFYFLCTALIILCSQTLFSQKSTQGVVPENQYKKDPSLGWINDLSEELIIKHTTFYLGDSLLGFDRARWMAESKKENIQLMVELQNFLHRKQSDFVKQKYNLEKLPWEIAKENYVKQHTHAPQPNKVAASVCNNIDFEDGNFSTWTTLSGYNPNSNLPLVIGGPAFISTNQDIYGCNDLQIINSSFVAAGDPIVSPVLDPNGGATSVRLGGFYNNVAWLGGTGMSNTCGSSNYWNYTYSNGQLISKAVAVTAANSLLSFDYAVVLNDGGHSNGQQPYFHIVVTNTAGVVLSTCTQYYVQAASGSPPAGFVNSGYVNTYDGSVLYYKGWTSNSINLTPYIGQTVIVQYSAAGCTQGAHCSWVYIDNVCSSAGITASNSAPCTGQNITLSAPAVFGGTYSWSGPGIVSGGSSQVATINAPGTYSVLVTPSQGILCAYTLTTSISYNPGPIVTASASNSVICNGNTTTLTGGGAASYAWSSGVTDAVAFSPSATANYTVVGTSSLGCVGSATITVTVNPIPVANAGTAAALNCTNTSVTLSGTGGGSYAWTGPGIMSGSNTATPIVNQPGSYNLQVTVSNCTSPISSVVVSQNTTTPTFVLGTASTVSTTCSAPNATLSASSSADPNTVYSWITPSTTTVTGNPIIASAVGIYTVVVTNTTTGCTNAVTASQATVQVVSDNSVPSPTLSSTSVSLTCLNATATVSLSFNSSYSYNWSPASGIVSGGNTSTPTFSLAGTYSAVVTNTTNNCASSAGSNVVTVVSNTNSPVLSLSSASNTGTLNCAILSINITPTITPSSNLTYTWSGSSGLASPANQSTATFTAIGIYSLSVTNTVTGCSSAANASSTFTVYQNNFTPTVSVVPTSSNTTIACASNTVVSYAFNSNASSGSSNVWNAGGITTPTFATTSGGVYTLTVVDAVSSCSTTNTFTVINASSPPANLSAGVNVAIPCGLTTTTLLATTSSSNTINYTWVAPASGTIVSGGNTASPLINGIGIYSVTAIDAITGCVATATVNVVSGNVFANFSASPNQGIAPLSVTFTNTSQNAISYIWNFGNGNLSSVTNPTTIYNNGGTFTVVLIATSGPCKDTAYAIIVVEDSLMMSIPNVFTPNNDNVNDVFTINSTGVKEISLSIFNRWGEKLYDFTGPKAGWDGIATNGGAAPDGTYFYFVKVVGFNKKMIEQHGSFTLFR